MPRRNWPDHRKLRRRVVRYFAGTGGSAMTRRRIIKRYAVTRANGLFELCTRGAKPKVVYETEDRARDCARALNALPLVVPQFVHPCGDHFHHTACPQRAAAHDG